MELARGVTVIPAVGLASGKLRIYDLITLSILRPAGGSSTISPVAFLISDAANPQLDVRLIS
jgi:hypothetical protein